MLVWTRLGFLVPILALAALVLAEYSVELFYHDSDFYQSNDWPMFVGTALAGIPIWFLGIRLNRNATKRLVEPDTGKEVLIDRKHTFFWVPMQYWAIILVVLSVVIAFVE